jgi:hypothetical protein
MLAREPRERYQTASELIVDLERSRLASAVPTFADPNQALQDPWVQQCLASSAEPTRLDPESPPSRPAPAPKPAPAADGAWVLRYRNRAGALCRVRATTEEVADRLRRGRLTARVEARRDGSTDYHALSYYREFKDVESPRLPPRARPKAGEKDETPVSRAASLGPEHRPGRLLLYAGGAAFLLLAVVFLIYLFLRGS